MHEKMNLVIKDVILEKWKSKIGYSFNFKDLEELEIIINQFDNHIKYLENKLQQKEDIINKITNYCKFQIEKEKDKFPKPLESKEWLKGRISAFEEILDNKG